MAARDASKTLAQSNRPDRDERTATMMIIALLLFAGIQAAVHTPTQTPSPTKPPVICTLINFGENTRTNTIRLSCAGMGQTIEDDIARDEWPAKQWGRPMRGDTYPMDADGRALQLTPEQLQAQKDYDRCQAQYMHDLIRIQNPVRCERKSLSQ